MAVIQCIHTSATSASEIMADFLARLNALSDIGLPNLRSLDMVGKKLLSTTDTLIIAM
jgi:hypothetical protein